VAVQTEETAVPKQLDWALARRILRYVRPYRWVALGALLASLAIAAASQTFPSLQRLLIDRYLLPPGGSAWEGAPVAERLEGVWGLAAVYLGVALGEYAARSLFAYALAWMGQRVLFDVRAEVFAKLQRLPLAYFDRNAVGRLLTRVTSDVDAINQFLTSGLVTLAQSLFVLAAVLFSMFWLDARLALVASAAIPLLFFTTRFFQVRFRDAFRRIRLKQAVVNTVLNESITGMGTLQLFNREARARGDFDRLNRDFLAANLDSVRWFSLFFPAVNLISSAALALVLWQGGRQVLGATVTLGTLFAFTQYVRNFFQPLQDLSDVFNTLQAAMASAERIFGVLDEPETVADRPLAPALQRLRGEVALEDVWFAYTPPGQEPTEEDWVLRGVSLTVRPGESVALVGATGAGKTSIISLVSRLYDVQRGRVRVDGVDVREVAQRSLRARVGVVLQDVFLFSGTLLSNLRLGHEHLPREAVEEACRQVGVHDFIASLPEGYDTEVKERGATLSTGQKQLLAFARVLLQQPDVLVLDEATASVDTESELRLQVAQARAMAGRTSIVIAHRLSTIQHCDRIVVLRRGQVVEEGTHAALLARGGSYATLYRLQYADQVAAA
jgi:ATP-binding cassette, subfamily B, multidrug efflux pump